MRDFRICPECKGKGETSVHVPSKAIRTFKGKGHETVIPGYIIKGITCDLCYGAGMVLCETAPGLRGSAADNSFMERGL